MEWLSKTQDTGGMFLYCRNLLQSQIIGSTDLSVCCQCSEACLTNIGWDRQFGIPFHLNYNSFSFTFIFHYSIIPNHYNSSCSTWNYDKLHINKTTEGGLGRKDLVLPRRLADCCMINNSDHLHIVSLTNRAALKETAGQERVIFCAKHF